MPKPRHDGWTPVRRAAFVAMLRRTGSVGEAAAHAGMSRASAYRLRARADGADFALDWDAALAECIDTVRATSLERAIAGERRPIHYYGRVIGERVRYDNRLLIRLLSLYDRPGARR